jgi:nicotinamide mononucleotide adenylyltransferase
MSPVHDAYGKAGLTHGKHRVAMCHAAVECSSIVMVDEWEVIQEGYTRTLQVLRHVREELVKLVADLEVRHSCEDQPAQDDSRLPNMRHM